MTSSSQRSAPPVLALALIATAAACQAPAAGAAGLAGYAQVGSNGLTLGLAQRYDNRFGARVDVSTFGTVTKNGVQEGVDYQGKFKANRLGLFGDWYPLGGSFRLTAGLTFNDARADLVATGAGKTFQVGNSQTVTTTAEDRFDVSIKFPQTMPYIGIGWGHHQVDGAGFLFDLGLSIGKATVTETHVGPNLSQISQADYDRELQQLRDGVAKMPGLPQLSMGVNLRF